jgi:hypothetical protein
MHGSPQTAQRLGQTIPARITIGVTGHRRLQDAPTLAAKEYNPQSAQISQIEKRGGLFP